MKPAAARKPRRKATDDGLSPSIPPPPKPAPPPPDRPVREHRGAKLELLNAEAVERGATIKLVLIDFPGTALDGHSMAADEARRLVDWWVDTGGDQSKLPKPYRSIKPARGIRGHAQAGATATGTLT